MRKIFPLPMPRSRRHSLSSLLLVLPILGLLALFGLALRQDRNGKPVDYLTLQDVI